MDQDHFEMLARQMAGGGSTRRAVMRFLAGGTLAGLGAGLGLTQAATAKPKSKRKQRVEKKRRKKRPSPSGCDAEQRQCADGSCIALGQCCPEASPTPCGACEEPVCVRGDVVCRSTCQFEGAECCNGHCLTACLANQQRNPQNCQCECPDSSVVLEDQMTCCPRDQACFFHYGLPLICCPDGTICVGGNLCT